MTSALNQSVGCDKPLTLLSRIASADKLAAKECIDIYGGMIWAMAKNLIGSDGETEKAVQEIFLDIWENAEFSDLSLSDEKIWIGLIARRRLNRYSTKH